MLPNLDALTDQALALPPQQRFELAQRLWISVEGQFDSDDALFAEISRRDAEIEAGTARTFLHEEVMRDARRKLSE